MKSKNYIRLNGTMAKLLGTKISTKELFKEKDTINNRTDMDNSNIYTNLISQNCQNESSFT